MTLNTDGTYSITANLIGGKALKFRANNAWDKTLETVKQMALIMYLIMAVMILP